MRKNTRLFAMLLLIFTFVLSGCLPKTEQFTLTITIQGEGTVTPVSGTKYNSNSVVPLTATPKAGWEFDRWAGTHGSSVTDHKIVMNSNKSITAVFVKKNVVPVANNDSALTSMGKAVTIDVLANDQDPDGSTLTVEIASTPKNGQAVVNSDQTITYTPNGTYVGKDSFTYSAKDPQGGSAVATVSITIADETKAVAFDDSVTTKEDTAVTISPLQNDTCPEGATLSIVNITTPAHGTVKNNNNGTVTYTPTVNYHGADSFDYTMRDSKGQTSTGTVQLTVTAVNDAPVVTNDNKVTVQNKAITMDLVQNDTDVDGDQLKVTAVTQPGHGTTTKNSDGTVTYTPAQDYFGADQFTYTVSDGTVTAQGTVKITVEEIVKENTAPVAKDDTVNTDEDQPLTFDPLVNDTDADGDSLSVVEIGTPAIGTLVKNDNNTFTYTPQQDFVGFVEIEYTITDGNGGSDSALITIVMHSVNDAPVVEDDYIYGLSGFPIKFYPMNNDYDPEYNGLQITDVTQPVQGVVTIEGDTLSYTPPEDFVGSVSFTYTVSDPEGLTSTATVIVSVELNTSNVRGTLNLSQPTTNYGEMTVYLDNDLDPTNGSVDSFLIAFDCGMTSVPYILTGAPGSYYLYAQNNFGWDNIPNPGDYKGIYGIIEGQADPTEPNLIVSDTGYVTADIDVYQEKGNLEVVLNLPTPYLEDRVVDLCLDDDLDISNGIGPGIQAYVPAGVTQATYYLEVSAGDYYLYAYLPQQTYQWGFLPGDDLGVYGYNPGQSQPDLPNLTLTTSNVTANIDVTTIDRNVQLTFTLPEPTNYWDYYHVYRDYDLDPCNGYVEVWDLDVPEGTTQIAFDELIVQGDYYLYLYADEVDFGVEGAGDLKGIYGYTEGGALPSQPISFEIFNLVSGNVDVYTIKGNLSGTLYLPEMASGASYQIFIDDDLDFTNGAPVEPLYGTIGESLTIDYTTDVPPGSYYVYAMVDMNGTYFMQGPIIGDMMGYYGTAYPNQPAAPNVEILDSTTKLVCDIDLSVLTENYYNFNLAGTINMPTGVDLTGLQYLVVVDTELLLDYNNIPTMYNGGIIDSTSTIDFGLAVPEGTYYVFVILDANGTEFFGDAGDYVAIYGTGYPSDLTAPNVVVGTDPVNLAPMDPTYLTEQADFVIMPIY